VRSWSIFGLSTVEMVFGEDSTDFDMNRERVLERLRRSRCPIGVVPQMGTDWSPVGQIYFYTLREHESRVRRDEPEDAGDWSLEKNLKGVPGVVDINPASEGRPREYQVRLDPDKLVSYG
jgi:heavy metal efflux system protein